MTSPVDTSVKNFNNTMVNAPVLNGVAGSMIALLDALLVTGFDTKALVSLVALGGVMTATYSGTHSSQLDSVVEIAGVAGGPTGFAGANGEQKITATPTATTRQWATALPDGTYTGTITMKMASCGWSKPFTGANKAVFRSNDVTGTRLFLRVDDSSTTAARVLMYETMTDVDTGTAFSPSTVIIGGGGYWAKSTVSSATAVHWAFAGDSRIFYINPLAGTASSLTTRTGVIRGFGDFTPYRPSGDPFGCILSYGVNATDGTGGLESGFSSGTVVARDFTGIGSAQFVTAYAFAGGGGYSGMSTGYLGAFPNAIDGALYFSPKILRQAAGQFYPRGELPGLYHLPQSGVFDTFAQLDRVPATMTLTGKALQMWNTAGQTNPYGSTSTVANTGSTAIDLTGPWR